MCYLVPLWFHSVNSHRDRRCRSPTMTLGTTLIFPPTIRQNAQRRHLTKVNPTDTKWVLCMLVTFVSSSAERDSCTENWLTMSRSRSSIRIYKVMEGFTPTWTSQRKREQHTPTSKKDHFTEINLAPEHNQLVTKRSLPTNFGIVLLVQCFKDYQVSVLPIGMKTREHRRGIHTAINVLTPTKRD